MKFKHIHTFWRKAFSVSEKRVVHMVDYQSTTPSNPDRPTRDFDTERKNRERWKEVFKRLEQTTYYKNNDSLKKLLRNEDYLHMISSLVTLRGDQSADWMPETALVYAEQVLDVFKNEEDTISLQSRNASRKAKAFVEQLNEAIADGEKQKKAYQDAGGSTPEVVAAFERSTTTIEKLNMSFEKLSDRQNGLIRFARALLKEKSLTVAQISALWKEQGQANAVLNKYFTGTNLRPVLKVFLDETKILGLPANAAVVVSNPAHKQSFIKAVNGMLDAIVDLGKFRLVGFDEPVAGQNALNEKRRNELLDDKGALDDEKTRLDAEEEALLNGQQYIKNRTEYFEFLNGHSVDLAIHNAFDKVTGEFDEQKLVDALTAINPEFKAPPGSDLRKELIVALGLNVDRATYTAKGYANAGEFFGKERLNAAPIPKLIEKLKELDSIRALNGDRRKFDAVTPENIVQAAWELLNNGRAGVGGGGGGALGAIAAAILGIFTGSRGATLVEQDVTKEIKNLLLSMWKQDALYDFLKKEGFQNNHLLQSATHIGIRSYIGPNNADLLINKKLGALSMGSLTDLSVEMFDGTNFRGRLTHGAAEKLLEYFASEVAGNPNLLQVRKKKFIDAMHFVFLEAGVDAEDEAEKVWAALVALVPPAAVDGDILQVSKQDLLFLLLSDSTNKESFGTRENIADALSRTDVREVDEAKLRAYVTKAWADNPPAGGVTGSEADDVWTTLEAEMAAGAPPIILEASVISGILADRALMPAAVLAQADAKALEVSKETPKKLLDKAKFIEELDALLLVTGHAAHVPPAKSTAEKVWDELEKDATTTKLVGGNMIVDVAQIEPFIREGGVPRAPAGAPGAEVIKAQFALPNTLNDILNLITKENAAGERNIDFNGDGTIDDNEKARFVALFTLLGESKGIAGARQKAEALLADPELVGGAPDFFKGENFVDKILPLLSGREFGAQSKSILDHLRISDAANKGMVDVATKVTVETLGTVGKGATLWWEWMSHLPGYYTDGDLSTRLVNIDNRRSAVVAQSLHIDNILKGATKGEEVMKEAIEALREMQAEQDAALKQTGVARRAFDEVKQANFLLLASEHVINVQNEEFSWKTIPDAEARYTAFWLAMKKTEGGLDQARDFLKQYHHLPEAKIGAYLQKSLKTLPPEARRFEYLRTMLPDDKKKFLALPLTNANEKDFHVAYLKGMSIGERRKIFLRIYREESLSKDQVNELMAYIGVIHFQRERRGGDIMSRAKNRHGLDTRPMALQALMGLGLATKTQPINQPPVTGTATVNTNTVASAMRVASWDKDRDGNQAQRAAVSEALDIVFEGPRAAKDALIEAFLDRKPVTYSPYPGGPTITMTPEEANKIVSNAQIHLMTLAEERQKNNDILSNDEAFSDPLERGLRAGIETLQDLWQGDWIDKAKVIGAVVAAVYLIRKIFTEGSKEGAPGWLKLLKYSVVGIPLLIVANSAIKEKTGRDYMGEWLHFSPQKDRNTSYERMRKDVTKESRYKFLGTNAGHEAMDQIAGPKSNIPVADLLAWREKVGGSPNAKDVGHNVYSNGAPEGLNINKVKYLMGEDATTEEAYYYAYLALEASLVNVARLNNQGGGSLHQQAERGADIVRHNYVNLKGWEDRPDIAKRLGGGTITLMDVIINESTTPETLDHIFKDRYFVEWLADTLGWGVGEVKSRGVQLVTALKLSAAQGVDVGTDLWPDIWNAFDKGVDKIYDFYRSVRPRLVNDLGKGIDAAWSLFLTGANAVGIAISKAPEAGMVVAKFVGDAAGFTIDAAVNIYDQARAHSTIGNLVNQVEAIIFSVFGVNGADLIALRGLYENNEERVDKLSEFPRMAEGLRNNLRPLINSTDIPLEDADAFREHARKWMFAVAGKEFGVANQAEFDALNSHEKMAVYEMTKRKVYSLIIAERVVALQDKFPDKLNSFKYPIDIKNADWDGLGGGTKFQLAEDIEDTFGFNSLALIGVEKNWAGAYQEWLIQSTGTTLRPPLQFLHFLIGWATFDEQTERLLGTIEVYKKDFLALARDHYKGDEDKIKAFEFYLETIVTNVALEAAMGAKDAKVNYGGKANLSPAQLSLLTEQAVSFGDYLDILRNFSADPRKIDLTQIDLTKFKSESQPGPELTKILKNVTTGSKEEKFLSVLQDITPGDVQINKAKAGASQPLDAADNARIDALAATPTLTDDEMDELLEFLARATKAAETVKINNIFDKIAIARVADWSSDDFDPANPRKGLGKPEGRALAMRLILGVSETGVFPTSAPPGPRDGKEILKELRKDFFETFSGWDREADKLAGLEEFNRDRTKRFADGELNPVMLGRLQDTLDKTIQGYFDTAISPTGTVDIKEFYSKITGLPPGDPGLKTPAYDTFWNNLKAKAPVDRKKDAKVAPLIDSLIELYKITTMNKNDIDPAATSTDHEPQVATLMSDGILKVIEHLVYMGEDNAPDPDEGGKTNFEKFESFMAKKGVIIPDIQSIDGISASANSARMGSESPFTEAPSFLETNGLNLGLIEHLNKINDKLKDI